MPSHLGLIRIVAPSTGHSVKGLSGVSGQAPSRSRQSRPPARLPAPALPACETSPSRSAPRVPARIAAMRPVASVQYPRSAYPRFTVTCQSRLAIRSLMHVDCAPHHRRLRKLPQVGRRRLRQQIRGRWIRRQNRRQHQRPALPLCLLDLTGLHVLPNGSTHCVTVPSASMCSLFLICRSTQNFVPKTKAAWPGVMPLSTTSLQFRTTKSNAQLSPRRLRHSRQDRSWSARESSAAPSSPPQIDTAPACLRPRRLPSTRASGSITAVNSSPAFSTRGNSFGQRRRR